MKRKALGKGLSALLPEAPQVSGEGLVEVDIDRIDPNPFQPRRRMQKEKLQELAKSLSQDGIMQPLLVRRVGSRFQLIAGERRWRAARLAGLARVPAVIRDVEEHRLLELALIENIQREELNPIEEAEAFSRLIEEFDYTQEDIAKSASKDRSTISNTMRLLNLPQSIQNSVGRGEISMGHARALLAVDDANEQKEVFNKIIKKGLSVREAEGLIQSKYADPARRKKTKQKVSFHPGPAAFHSGPRHSQMYPGTLP